MKLKSFFQLFFVFIIAFFFCFQPTAFAESSGQENKAKPGEKGKDINGDGIDDSKQLFKKNETTGEFEHVANIGDEQEGGKGEEGADKDACGPQKLSPEQIAKLSPEQASQIYNNLADNQKKGFWDALNDNQKNSVWNGLSSQESGKLADQIGFLEESKLSFSEISSFFSPADQSKIATWAGNFTVFSHLAGLIRKCISMPSPK